MSCMFYPLKIQNKHGALMKLEHALALLANCCCVTSPKFTTKINRFQTLRDADL